MSKNNEGYITYFPEIYNEILEKTNKRLNRYNEKGLPPNASYYYKLLLNGFEDIAIGEIILNNDVIRAKQHFYLAAKMQEIIFQKYDNKENDIPSDYVTTDSYPTLYMALISGNKSLIRSLSALFGGRLQEETEDFEINKLIGYSVKYLILGETDKATTQIKQFFGLKFKKYKQYYLSYASVLNGILEKDKIAVHDGLIKLLENHTKLDDYEDTPQILLSLPVLGLAKLAALNGLEFEIDSELAPKKLLEDIDINYPVVDFVE